MIATKNETKTVKWEDMSNVEKAKAFEEEMRDDEVYEPNKDPDFS